jgi:hypothetical protein
VSYPHVSCFDSQHITFTMSSIPPTSLPALTAARVPIIHQLYPRARWMTRAEFRNGTNHLPSIYNIFVEDYDTVGLRPDWIDMNDRPVPVCHNGSWENCPETVTFFHPSDFNLMQMAERVGNNGWGIALFPIRPPVLLHSGVLQAHGYLRAIPLTPPPSDSGAGRSTASSRKDTSGNSRKDTSGHSRKDTGGNSGTETSRTSECQQQ